MKNCHSKWTISHEKMEWKNGKKEIPHENFIEKLLGL